MKKYLGIIGLAGFLVLSLFLGNTARAQSLSQYFKQTNRPFMACNQERKLFAAENGVFNYDCSAKKNAELIEHLKLDDALIGFSVVTRYRTTLSSSLTSSNGTINVSSILTFDGTTLSMSLLGAKVYLTIDPGNSKEEIVQCTGISGNSFTGCTRGLAFSGTSTSAVQNNQKAHTSGSVIIMSNVHYVYEELIDKDTESEFVTGTKWFLSNGMVLGDRGTAQKFFYFCDTTATSSCGYIFAKASTTAVGSQDIGFSPDGTTEYTFNSGGTVLSVGKGLNLTSGLLIFRPAATGTGALGYSGNQVIVSTTFPNGLYINADGLALSTSTPNTWTGLQTFSSTNTVRFGSFAIQASSTANAIIQAQPDGTIESNFLPLQVTERLLNATTTDAVLAGGSTAVTGTIFATTSISAGLMGTSGTLHVHLNIDAMAIAGSDNGVSTTLVINGLNVLEVGMFNAGIPAESSLEGELDAYIYNSPSTTLNAQEIEMQVLLNRVNTKIGAASTTVYRFTSKGQAITNTALPWSFSILGKMSGNVVNGMTIGRGFAELINHK